MARGVPYKGIKTRQPTIKRLKKENEDRIAGNIAEKRNKDSRDDVTVDPGNRDTTFDRKGQMDLT